MKRAQEPLVMPILSAGRHRNPRQGACFMEFASYLAGERWSDHPRCTHPVLAALARDVNDRSSDAARNDLMSLVHRVVGLTSDDPRVMARIAVRAAAAALPIASLERQRALAVALLGVLSRVDDRALGGMCEAAFDATPGVEAWARDYLAHAHYSQDFGPYIATVIVHTSVAGIADACVDDTDARLGALLRETVDDVESMVRPVALPQRELAHAP